MQIYEHGAGERPPNWEQLLDAVIKLRPGPDDSTEYQKSAAELLAAVFYPGLSHPILEHRLHEGRKRVDITFWNMANTPGFFQWVANHHPASYILVECKNYAGDPANPELDQLSGRFGPNGGRVGILVYRSFEDKDLFLRRCRDTALDGRGFIIPLDDQDLRLLVEARAAGKAEDVTALLKTRFDELVM